MISTDDIQNICIPQVSQNSTSLNGHLHHPALLLVPQPLSVFLMFSFLPPVSELKGILLDSGTSSSIV